MKKVSIIVPVYNVGNYLDTCITSLVNQTLKEIEILLIDDGSTDDSPAICDKYSQTDTRVRVIHKENGGLGSARNCGLEVASGEYVTFVDGDDYLETDAYEKMYNLAKEHNLDIIRYRANRFVKEGVFTEKNDDLTLFQINDRDDIRQSALCIFSDPIFPGEKKLNLEGSVCFALMRLSIFKENNIQCISERRFPLEDTEFSYNIYQHANSIGKVPATFYHYRINQASISHTIKLDKIEKTANQCVHMLKLLKRDNYPDNAKYYIYNFYINHSRTFIAQCLGSNLSTAEKKAWVKKQSVNPFVLTIYRDFPLHKIPLINRLFFKGLVHNNYILLKFLATLKNIKNR